MGYYRAGFTNIVGVDNKPQPNYPFEFVQADALEYMVENDGGFDFIHASPPCQAFSVITHNDNHENLVDITRELICNVPYVIENVPGAPLVGPVTLCGSSFGLRVRKHRLFESNVFLFDLPCNHKWQNDDKIYTVRNHGETKKTGVCYVFGTGGSKGEDWNTAMGIEWMTRKELSQAIPPAYTEYIGRQILEPR